MKPLEFFWISIKALILASAVLGVVISILMFADMFELFQINVSLCDLRYLITLELGIMSVFGFLFVHDGDWKNLMLGIPIFMMNVMMICIWWRMEIHLGMGVEPFIILFLIISVINFMFSVIYLLRNL